MTAKRLSVYATTVIGLAVIALTYVALRPEPPCATGREITAGEAIELATIYASQEQYFWQKALGLTSGAELASRVGATENCCSARKETAWVGSPWIADIAVVGPNGRVEYRAIISSCGKFIEAGWVKLGDERASVGWAKRSEPTNLSVTCR